MLKWFNKESTSSPSSKKSTENQQYSQQLNSTLTESDYEFLFNQLLDGVAHGWHLGKIIKFFNNLESRSNIAQWIDWVERFEKKINYSSDPSQKKVGAIMMRFGELTKPNDDLKKLGNLFYRIGNQLFASTSLDLIWEYSGQDLVAQESHLNVSEVGVSHENLTEFPDEVVEAAISNQNNSTTFASDNHVELDLEKDLANQAEIELQSHAVAEQNVADQILEESLVAQEQDLQTVDGLLDQSATANYTLDEEILVNNDLVENLDGEGANHEDPGEFASVDLSIDEEINPQPIVDQPQLESINQSFSEEFSAEEELINQAFEENLAAQHHAAQVVNDDSEPLLAEIDADAQDQEISSEDELINQAFEENMAVRAVDDTSQTSSSNKFSPEEELINQAFEEGLAAQSKKSESASDEMVITEQTQDNSQSELKDREVVLDLSLDLPPEEIRVDEEGEQASKSDQHLVIKDLNQESVASVDSPSEDLADILNQDADVNLNNQALELQKLDLEATELEVAENKFSVSSFLEATEALSTNQGNANKQVTVTWEEFVSALEQDPFLARNVAQHLGLVGVDNPRDIVQAAVDKFRAQKQAQLSPANIELVKSWFQLGLKQASAKDFLGAISSWDQALSLNPNLSEAWHNKGSALGRLGKYVEAIQSFDRAVHLDPESYQAWNDRAHALYKMQEWPKAISSWDRAIQIMPDRHQFWYNRGCALEQIKSFDESIASYEKALEIKPDFQPARARHTVLIANNF